MEQKEKQVIGCFPGPCSMGVQPSVLSGPLHEEELSRAISTRVALKARLPI